MVIIIVLSVTKINMKHLTGTFIKYNLFKINIRLTFCERFLSRSKQRLTATNIHKKIMIFVACERNYLIENLAFESISTKIIFLGWIAILNRWRIQIFHKFGQIPFKYLRNMKTKKLLNIIKTHFDTKISFFFHLIWRKVFQFSFQFRYFFM